MLDEWMEKEGEGAAFAHRSTFGSKKFEENRSLKMTQRDPFKQIHWATLLDPMSHNPGSLQQVASWSKMRARTVDGGEVLAGPESVSVTKLSKAALSLAMDEGIARGWKSHKMQGTPEFCRMAMEIAREKGITAEITVQGKFFGRGKTIHVMPNVHPPSKEILEEIFGSPAEQDAGGGQTSTKSSDQRDKASETKMSAPEDDGDVFGETEKEKERKARLEEVENDGPGM
jgi:hypothetical protein